MREWPDDWDERVRGKGCAMCAEGRPERVGANVRISQARSSDAYLVNRDVGQRGYTLVIWRGRHVADPTELATDEASEYFAEVLKVGRAIERHYRPIKVNLEMLGNSVPHLHTHVVPRYRDDGGAGHPANFMRRTDPRNDPPLPQDEYDSDVAALRALLRG